MKTYVAAKHLRVPQTAADTIHFSINLGVFYVLNMFGCSLVYLIRWCATVRDHCFGRMA